MAYLHPSLLVGDWPAAVGSQALSGSDRLLGQEPSPPPLCPVGRWHL